MSKSNAVRKDEDGPQSSRQIVRRAADQALSEASGEVLRAKAIMSEMARTTQALRDALVEPWIDQAAYEAVREVSRDRRGVIWDSQRRATPASLVSDADKIVLLANSNAQALMDFPLPGGKRLGDAIAEEVRTAAGFYYRQAGNMMAKGRWLAKIAVSVPDGKRVSEALDEAKLKDIQIDAQISDR